MATSRQVKAAKPKQQTLDYWRKNCFNCAYFRRIHILENGKDDGSVRFQCTQKDEDVIPHKIDGCRKFEQGEPMSESVNVETKHKSDVSSAKSGVSEQKSGVSSAKKLRSDDTSDITSDIQNVTMDVPMTEEVSE